MASSLKNWQLGEAGILRKKEEEEELLVFGYSCKLFRDDEKALYIDQGKHLIPWMGDSTLKIDRYDGRGALYDLKHCEAKPGGHDENQWVGMSDAERYVEQLCNEERYRSLHNNDSEEATYQEEELKRLHQALGAKTYGEVEFNYDQPPSESKPEAQKEAEVDEDDDKPFVAPPELDIPVNMVLPEKVKLNAIIEKTAMFISHQGAQMEILLKMKQANNPQFQFLSYDSPLHPYYRHLQMAIKTGRYHPKSEQEETEDNEDDEDDGSYLHPSLASGSSRVELAPSIPSIAYKPSADCAYSMLVNRIKDKQAAFSGRPQEPAEVVQPIIVPVCKSTLPIIEATPVIYNQARAEPTIDATPVFQSKTPAKIFTPVLHQTIPVAVIMPRATKTVTPSFLVPPADVQLIIDKMASYVAKNGRDFESIVRAKGDPRFEFLQVQHQYYPYYLHKVDVYEQLETPSTVPAPATVVEQKREPRTESSDSSASGTSGDEAEDHDHLPKPALAPVCFSIKKPKDPDPVLDLKSALPLEESSDEEKPPEDEEVKTEPVVESIDLTDDTAMNVDAAGEREEKKTNDKDRWEERVKDKLAAAAREKLAATTREKQLQLERKRRAAAFLNMIHKTQPKPADSTGNLASGDEDEVSSIPSPMSTNSSSANPGNEEAVGNGAPSSLLARIQGSKEVERRRRHSGTDSDTPKERKSKPKKSKSSHNRSRQSTSPAHKHSREEEHGRSRRPKKQSRTKSSTNSKSRRDAKEHHHSNDSSSKSSTSRSKKSRHKSKRSRKSSSSEHSS